MASSAQISVASLLVQMYRELPYLQRIQASLLVTKMIKYHNAPPNLAIDVAYYLVGPNVHQQALLISLLLACRSRETVLG